ncbi:MAG TPA: nitrate reductase molybdenum cofactor assembly chaperone, partial [Methylophilaceae bacterium]|nr:nitrate reductase molybdenum cofactor assembly chaperone [Methylophilaceae bacterium]
MQIYKLLSALLDYPNQELIEHLPELREFVVQNQEIDYAEREALQGFLAHLQRLPVTELQADYVKTFDMTAEHSLHLTH